MKKFDKKTLLALGAGLGAALIATFLFAMIDAFNEPKQMQKKLVEVRVLKALQDIHEGTELTPEMVAYTTVPAHTVSDDVIVDLVQVANLKTARPVSAEAVLNKSDFEQNATKTTIPKGQVAMSLQIDTVSGVTWQLKAGDFVDIIGVLRPTEPRDRRGNIATVQLQAIRVLSIEPPKQKKDQPIATNEKGTITLLMTPKQAQELMLVSTAGNYSLALRGVGDDTEHEIKPLSDAEIIAQKAASKKIKRPKQIAVRNRLQVVEVK
jgi:pilus assembly protein CpaB